MISSLQTDSAFIVVSRTERTELRHLGLSKPYRGISGDCNVQTKFREETGPEISANHTVKKSGSWSLRTRLIIVSKMALLYVGISLSSMLYYSPANQDQNAIAHNHKDR
jgi:hypothetical protein